MVKVLTIIAVKVTSITVFPEKKKALILTTTKKIMIGLDFIHPSGIDRKKILHIRMKTDLNNKTKLFGYWLTFSNSLHKIQKDVKQVMTF